MTGPSEGSLDFDALPHTHSALVGRVERVRSESVIEQLVRAQLRGSQIRALCRRGWKRRQEADNIRPRIHRGGGPGGLQEELSLESHNRLPFRPWRDVINHVSDPL